MKKPSTKKILPIEQGLVNFKGISMFKKIIRTHAQRTTILVRLMVGAVFLSEGLQKFLFADKLGAGRFAKIGLPNPEF